MSIFRSDLRSTLFQSATTMAQTTTIQRLGLQLSFIFIIQNFPEATVMSSNCLFYFTDCPKPKHISHRKAVNIIQLYIYYTIFHFLGLLEDVTFDLFMYNKSMTDLTGDWLQRCDFPLLADHI